MLEMRYGNKMQTFALTIALVLSVILMAMPSVSAEDHDISITDDMKFNPEDLTINIGDTVTWTNNDGMGHTATSTDEPASFDSENIAAGATWSFTFTEAGTYDYKCNYHSAMTATITVVDPDNGGEDDEEDDNAEDELPMTDSDWFNWTMNGTHHSILAVTNDSLNWTHVSVSIYNDTGVYQQPSHLAFVWYKNESDIHMNLTFLENGTHFANITLYNNEDILAYHNWIFVIGEGESPDCDFVIGVDSTNYTFNPNLLSIKFGETVCWQLNSYSGNVAQVSNSTSIVYVSGFRSGEANITFNSNNSFYVIFNSIYGYSDNTTYYYISEPHAGLQMRGEIIIGTGSEALDGDNDGISDDNDACPEEDASGHDADADGCIDDSDGDGIKNNVDDCPFGPTSCQPEALENNTSECAEGDIKNEDCNSCSCESDPDGNLSWVCTEMDCEEMKEDSPGFGFAFAVLSCIIIASRRRL